MRRRLTLAIAAVAIAAVVLPAVPLAIMIGRSQRAEAMLRLQRDTVAATREIDVSVPNDPVELPSASGLQLAAYDRSGRRVAGHGPKRAPPLVRAALREGRPADGTAPGRLVVALPLQRDERLSGAVLGQRSDAAVVEDIHAAWLVLAAVASGIVLAAVLAALVLGGRLARPLERLAGIARRLGDGDFTVRAPRAGIAEVDGVASALDATAERLGQLIARERAFTADASHQLRTPLAALRLELEALQLRSDDPELEAAVGQVERLQGTIDTLLAVARDHPRAEAVTTLAPVLHALEAEWHGQLAAETRPLRLIGDARAVRVRASPGVVREILAVLLANACIHGRGAVTVDTRQTDAWVFVEVSDEGPGFRDAGTPFSRRGDSPSGHGIGLALAQALAHAEGGRLTITRSGPAPVVTLMLRGATVDSELRASGGALTR